MIVENHVFFEKDYIFFLAKKENAKELSFFLFGSHLFVLKKCGKNITIPPS